MKHLQVKDLWVQEAIREYGVALVKIPREDNVADALASPSSRGDQDKHLSSAGVSWDPTGSSGFANIAS